jgi:hypothetical protein
MKNSKTSLVIFPSSMRGPRILSMRTLGDVEVVPSLAPEDRSQAFRHEAIFFSVPRGHFLVELRYFVIAFVGGQLQSKRKMRLLFD